MVDLSERVEEIKTLVDDGKYFTNFDLMVGYMLSFSFNKNKTPGVSEIRIGDKLLYEGIV